MIPEKARLLLSRPGRYNNHFIDWNALKPLSEQMTFVGLEQEHKDFCDKYFKVEYSKVKDALEAATILNSVDCVIGNQSGLFSIAEMLKVPRLLLTPEYMDIVHNGKTYCVPGPCNNVCQGGTCAIINTQAKLEAIVRKIKNEENS